MTPLRLLLALALAALAAGCAGTPHPGMEDNPGVRFGESATFDARHHFEIVVPEGSETIQVWLPWPNPHDRSQDLVSHSITTSPEMKTSTATDQWGNQYVYITGPAPAGTLTVDIDFELRRREINADLDPSRTRPHTAAEKAELARYLEGSSQSIIDADVRRMASNAVGAETNPILASRKIYDAILEHVEYHVKDPRPDAEKVMNSTGTGSSALTYTSCTGNCTDFHSLYAAVSRAAGIPTRVVYGSFFKGPLAGEDKDQSYHCWVEFHAPNVGWIPLDVAVADIFVSDFQANDHSRPRAVLTVANGYGGPDAKLVDYYFGNLEDRRVTWHYGRDLRLMPPQAGDPLLWNPKGYAEVDGKPVSVKRKLTFEEVR